MIFINNVKYVKVWKVEHFEKFISLQTSTGEKKQDGNYENSQWYVRLVGGAFDAGRHIKKGDTIEIVKGKITNVWNEDKHRSYLNIVAFEINTHTNNQSVNNNRQQQNNQQDNFNGFKSVDDSDEIPFF